MKIVRSKWARHLEVGLMGVVCALLFTGPLRAATPVSPPRADILNYIATGWTALTRSMGECKSLHDSKSSGPSILYFPADFPIPAVARSLARSCPVRLEHLPVVIHRLGEIDVSKIHPQGLLYLPHPYVVPGGRFNEMYGWDSYFILRGLLQAGKLSLARGMVENFFFEIAHYGGILNANRTYYLTRSQPPFLTAMVRAIYNAEKARGKDDRAWLREAYAWAVEDDEFWTRAPHLAGNTGLSRYFDFGHGPVPELDGSADAYYRHAASYFLAHPGMANGYLVRSPGPQPGLVSPLFPEFLCNGKTKTLQREPGAVCRPAGTVSLSANFYKGDRALRESGFDITFKFGPYGAGTVDYAPVGLNCLLYKEEVDLAWMAKELGKGREALDWQKLADERRERINKYFWNSQRDLYFDYNFKTEKLSDYVYATTFYPLWVGAASPEQAEAVIRNLKVFEEPGGIVTSRKQTGAQWDYPYGWAPLELIAVEGLRRYDDNADADRVSADFLSMVASDFKRDHTIREKYDVVTRSSEMSIQIGYNENVIGFGWTNGVFLVLLHELPGGSSILGVSGHGFSPIVFTYERWPVALYQGTASAVP